MTQSLGKSTVQEFNNRNMLSSVSVPIQQEPKPEYKVPQPISSHPLESTNNFIESGPMRESELMMKDQFPNAFVPEIRSYGFDSDKIEPSVLPQIEEFCQLL